MLLLGFGGGIALGLLGTYFLLKQSPVEVWRGAPPPFRLAWTAVFILIMITGTLDLIRS